MSLRYALLALLTSHPMTGYDVYKHFRDSVGYVWHAPDSQIYPELCRMERTGLLHAREVPRGKKGTKKQYTITSEGATRLREWMNQPQVYTRERDPVHLKAAYLEWADPESARAQMHAHIAHHSSRAFQWQAMVCSLEDRTHATLAKRLEAAPEKDWLEIAEYKIFAYEGMISRAHTEIRWARRGLELVDTLQRQRPSKPECTATATRNLKSELQEEPAEHASPTAPDEASDPEPRSTHVLRQGRQQDQIQRVS